MVRVCLGGKGAACCGDTFEDGGKVMQDVVVADAEDVETASSEDAIALGIRLCLGCVDGPVHLNDQPCGGAIEVDDEAVDDLLPAKVQSIQTVTTQRGPEQPLGERHRPAQFARAFGLHLSKLLPLRNSPRRQCLRTPISSPPR